MSNKERYRLAANKAVKNSRNLTDKELKFLLNSVQTNPNILHIVRVEWKLRFGRPGAPLRCVNP